MEINYFAIIIAAIVVFALGPIWFWFLFWNLWMKIHGWEKMSKDELKKQNEGMWKLMFTEAIGTLLMVGVLAFFTLQASAYYELAVAFFVWIWFLVPSVVSGVIWWADKKEFQLIKIMILCSFNFVALMIAWFIFSLWL